MAQVQREFEERMREEAAGRGAGMGAARPATAARRR